MAHRKKRYRMPCIENLNNRSLQLFLTTNDDIRENTPKINHAPKILTLQDTNINRYKKEFLELAVIRVGQFGKVYQYLNRLHGCIYAIKKSIKPVADSSFKKRALNQVWAHAVLALFKMSTAMATACNLSYRNVHCRGTRRINRQCHQMSETTGPIFDGRFNITFTSIYSYWTICSETLNS
uniref:Protein kinase domain-containing protein n=1 Tax=Glossina palpalis gambiensis TaxID=67801 RepID=A0A1B0C4Z3_9MUSC